MSMSPLTYLLSLGCEDAESANNVEVLVEQLVASRVIPFEMLSESIIAIKPLANEEGREFAKSMVTNLDDLAMLSRR